MSGTFLELVFQNLMALLPFVIVLSYQRGVRWTLGRNAKELLPGPHWKIWLLHKVEVSDVTDEFIELPIQTVTTLDGVVVSFGANVGYRISDIVKHWENVQDFVASTHGCAMTHLAERMRKENYSAIANDLAKLEKSLEGTLTTRFKRWGTEVFSVGFTNFAKIRPPLRVFMDQKLPEINSNTH